MGVWCQALSLPRPPVLWGGQPGFRDPCVPGAVGAGVGTRHRFHSVRPCRPALLSVGVAEGRPRVGCLPPLCRASEVRRCPPSDCPPTGRAVGVCHPRATLSPWPACPVGAACRGGGRGPSPGGGGGVGCQALSLPRPPVLWSGQSGFRGPCVPGAVGAGMGTQHRPHNVRPCGPVLLAVGVAEGRPRVWVPSTFVRGVRGQALSLPQLPAHWAGCRGPPPTCCGRGCVGVGAQHCPLGLHALWGLRAAGVVGGPSPGGGVACHRCEGRLVSGDVPCPAARPLERAAGVLRPVCPRCGWCGRGDPAQAPQRAPLRAGVARYGGGGRASPGGGAFHHCEGRLRSGAVPPSTARPLGGLLGSATNVPWARVCGCGGPTLSPWPACPVGTACRGGGGGPSPGGRCLPLF